MPYCYTHGINHASYDCPRCEAEKRNEELVELLDRSIEQAQERHEESARAFQDAEYKRANPGDYQCPECLYVTLKRRAHKCPKCHAAIRSEYWQPIYAREAAQAEEAARQKRLAAEEWARGEPERQRRAKAESEEKERTALEAKHKAQAKRFLKIYIWCFVPGLAVASSHLLFSVMKGLPTDFRAFYLMFFVPGLNWLFLLVGIFGEILTPPKTASSAFASMLVVIALILWLAVGFGTSAAIHRRK